MSTDAVREDMCGFEEVTVVPEPIKTRPNQGELQNVTYPHTPPRELTAEERAIIGGLFVCVVLLCACVCVCSHVHMYVSVHLCVCVCVPTRKLLKDRLLCVVLHVCVF